MSNVLYFKETLNFATKIADRLDDYEVCVAHEHSLFVLIAHKKYKIKGKWHTWINYDKFTELYKSKKPFKELDYCEVTPEWALLGNDAKGFDPKDVRHYRNKKKDQVNTKKIEL